MLFVSDFRNTPSRNTARMTQTPSSSSDSDDDSSSETLITPYSFAPVLTSVQQDTPLVGIEKPVEEKPLFNKPVRPSNADPERNKLTLFISNVPVDVSRKQLKALCGRDPKLIKLAASKQDFLPIDSIRLRSIPKASQKLKSKLALLSNQFAPTSRVENSTMDTKNTCTALCVYKSEKHAELACTALRGSMVNGKHLFFDLINQAPKKHENQVFIGNIAINSTIEDIYRFFVQHLDPSLDVAQPHRENPPIIHCQFPRNPKTFQLEGYGFMTLRDDEMVNRALLLHDMEFFKLKLRISKAKTNYSRKKIVKKSKKNMKIRATKKSVAEQQATLKRTPYVPRTKKPRTNKSQTSSNSSSTSSEPGTKPVQSARGKRSFQGLTSNPGQKHHKLIQQFRKQKKRKD